MLNQLLHLILGLTFLPDRARAWLFGTGTRVVECLNLTLLLIMSAVFLIDSSMLRLANYRGFELLFGDYVHEWMAVILGLLAVLSALGIALTADRPRRLGGFALLVSGSLWFAMAAGFGYGYPPLTTGMVVYPVLGLFCWLCGQHVMYLSEEGRMPGKGCDARAD